MPAHLWVQTLQERARAQRAHSARPSGACLPTHLPPGATKRALPKCSTAASSWNTRSCWSRLMPTEVMAWRVRCVQGRGTVQGAGCNQGAMPCPTHHPSSTAWTCTANFTHTHTHSPFTSSETLFSYGRTARRSSGVATSVRTLGNPMFIRFLDAPWNEHPDSTPAEVWSHHLLASTSTWASRQPKPGPCW